MVAMHSCWLSRVRLSPIWLAVALFSLAWGVAADGLNPQSHPAANEVIPVGKPYEIVWSPGTDGPVKIALLDNDHSGSQNITLSTPNSGSYTWTPSAELATFHGGSDYFMVICDIITPDCTYTFSGRFSFSNAEGQGTSSDSSSSTATTVTASQSTDASSESTAPDGVVFATSTSGAAQSSSRTSSPVSGSNPASSNAQSPSPSSSNSATIGGTGPPDKGLSQAAKIAIGVVVSVVGTAALFVGGFFIYRKGQRSRPSAQPPVRYPSVLKPELPADSVAYREMGRGKELPYKNSTVLHELSAGYS